MSRLPGGYIYKIAYSLIVPIYEPYDFLYLFAYFDILGFPFLTK